MATFGQVARVFSFGALGGYLVQLLLPEIDQIAQHLKIDQFIRIAFVFKEQGQRQRRLVFRLGAIDQIAKVAAQPFINKGVFDQMQVSQINLLRHGRWQVMAQKISRHLRMT